MPQPSDGDPTRDSLDRPELTDGGRARNRVATLSERLQSNNTQLVENTLVELGKIASKNPEEIQPIICRLQELARNGEAHVPGKALSVLSWYSEYTNKKVIKDIKNTITNLLDGETFNQQNALIAATAAGDSDLADQVAEVVDNNQKTSAAAELTHQSLVNRDLSWLEIGQNHVRLLVTGGTGRLSAEGSLYLLYLMDSRYEEYGQRYSAWNQIHNSSKISKKWAVSAVRFIEEFDSTSSLHYSVLSDLAKSHPNVVIDQIRHPSKKIRGLDRKSSRQFLWTLADIAEQLPGQINKETVEVCRDIVDNNSGKKRVKQAQRVLEAVKNPTVEATAHSENEVVKSTDQTRNNSTDSYSSDKMLDELRKRAEEAAREDPVQKQVTSTSSQYYRSSAIKEYARARANGICECCGKLAPFNDQEGQPYLEVHHVEELGEGGSDSPDTVAAICPTCHTQIHYGKDGKELNKKLNQKITGDE